MVTLRIIILILHVTAAAFWIGPTLGLVKSVRRALPVNKDAFGLALADYRFRAGLAAIGGMGVIVTGVTLIFLAGGFKAIAPPIHAALGMAILAAVHSAVFGRGMKALEQAHATYDVPAIASAEGVLKKLSMHTHISHTLWLASLVMMFWAQVMPRA